MRARHVAVAANPSAAVIGDGGDGAAVGDSGDGGDGGGEWVGRVSRGIMLEENEDFVLVELCPPVDCRSSTLEAAAMWNIWPTASRFPT